jgi:sugar lactone lactonase YvrE
MTTATLFDDRVCELGEGPLWHPERGQLFWFDIIGQRLLSVAGGTRLSWDFDEPVSAAGWVDRDTLLIASASALFSFGLADGARAHVATLEADNPATRSNDGRADPQGGFWIGTMARDASPQAGAIYRWYRGELRQLYAPISTPNAICFTPDGRHAYFTDTGTHVVRRVALDGDGWPAADPAPWLDLTADGLRPDGAVTDADGNVWIAIWRGARMMCFAPDGTHLRSVDIPAPLATCPAFGGADLATLYCTSATRTLDAAERAAAPLSGQTFAARPGVRGRAEPRVIL